MSEISAEAIDEARRYVRRKRIFYTVLGVWIALCAMWFLIDLSDDSSSWWFYWPMLGSGIAVGIVGIVLLGIGALFGANWERREIERYLSRLGGGGPLAQSDAGLRREPARSEEAAETPGRSRP